MWNPVQRLKQVLVELLANGQQARLDAARTAERLEAMERRFGEAAADTQSLKQDLGSLKEDVAELLARSRQSPPTGAWLDALDQRLDLMAADTRRLTAIEAALQNVEAACAAMRDKVFGPPAIEPQRVYFGLDELDRALSAYLDIDDGYFVELGANDGIAQSNTLHFEKFRGWSGVLVEPTPHNFLKCRANRSSRTRIFCCACTGFDYAGDFVEVAFSNLMTTPIGLESDIADPIAHAQQGRRFLAPTDAVFTFGARARPLNDLLIEAGSPAMIDLLSLDVEGAEMEVLKGIDHDRFRFRYMCVECRDIDRMTAYLATKGYEFVEKLSGHDFLFRDKRAVQ